MSNQQISLRLPRETFLRIDAQRGGISRESWVAQAISRTLTAAETTSETTVSLPPVPEEAFELFPGRWIALRGGEVVADGATVDELWQNERVEATDALFRVPETGTLFYGWGWGQSQVLPRSAVAASAGPPVVSEAGRARVPVPRPVNWRHTRGRVPAFK